jgi:PST family polysaccharide transporter
MARKDYQKLFDTKHLHTDLKKRSLRSGAVTLTTQAISFVIHLVSTMILARILTPDDYGMMAMVVAITGLAGVLLNLGLSTATIQREEITHEQVSVLFWINAGVGALLMLIVAGLSPVIAWFYNLEELAWVALALSSTFLINGLSVQHQALLNRQMRFFTLAIIQVIAAIVGVSVAIVAALHGLGYWALVLNTLAVSTFTSLATWYSTAWLPGSPQRGTNVGQMIRFGADIMWFNLVNYFSRNLDNILIGKFHGGVALGIYSKAYQLLMMPITNLRDPLNKVATPALSRLQNDSVLYRNYYMKFLNILALVSMPLIVFMFTCSEQIILIVLGEQWSDSGEIFKILALVALVQVVSSTRGTVLITTGKSRRYLILGSASAVIFSISFVLGLPWGAKGVAMSYMIATYLVFIPFMAISFRDTPVCVYDFFKSIYVPLIASLFMGILCHFFLVYNVGLGPLALVVSTSFIGFFSYIILLLTFGTRSQIIQVFDYFRLAFDKGKI